MGEFRCSGSKDCVLPGKMAGGRIPPFAIHVSQYIMLESIQPFSSLESLHVAAVDAFCDLADATVDRTGRFSVSLSGGSTPKRIYEMLSERDLPWRLIHWFWGDERNVPHDHADSNYRMVCEALLNRVDIPSGNIHAVPVNVEDSRAAATEYDKAIRAHFDGDAFPKWDLALLGMGDDAHTASLFPETKAIDESEKWFVENWVEKFDAFRYTMTAPAINSANEIWFLIAGENKQVALANVFSDEKTPALYPSQLIQPTRWFISADAMPQ